MYLPIALFLSNNHPEMYVYSLPKHFEEMLIDKIIDNLSWFRGVTINKWVLYHSPFPTSHPTEHI